MIRFFLFLCLFYLPLFLFSQDDDDSQPVFAVRLSFEYSAYLGQTTGVGANVIPGKTYNLAYGLDFETKFGKHFGTGLGGFYNLDNFALKQDDSKFVPSADLHKKEQYKLRGFKPEFFVTIYPGDYQNGGIYIRMAGYGNLVFGQDLRIRDIAPQSAPYRFTDTRFQNLEYISKYQYGAKITFGYKSVAFIATYRLTDVFTEQYKQMYPVEFPRFLFGIILGSTIIEN